jgi:hypothetical protein
MNMKKRGIVYGYWLAVLLGAACWLAVGLKWLNRPAIGQIKTVESGAASSSSDTVGSVKFDGELAAFVRKEDLSSRPAQNHHLPGDQLLFVAGGGVQRQLAVEAVGSVASLQDDPSYRLRKKDPQVYLEEHQKFGSDEVIIMSRKIGSYEQVAFWRHGSIAATIALTATVSANQDLKNEFSQILASWQWK